MISSPLSHARDRVLSAVDAIASEAVAFTSDLIRFPTVNPPGEGYRECAEFIGRTLENFGFDVEYVEADGRVEHSQAYPRVNVVGGRRGIHDRPCMHLNGHFDVVPAGSGWTMDPFAGEVRDGRIYGRGACDMKAGISAAIFAAEALRRAGVSLAGSIEISGTVDEESGGYAGMALLCERGMLARDRTDFVIIPEPLGVDRICVGHRGVYWFEVTTHGRIGHGSMPFLGVNAIEHMGYVFDAFRRDLQPRLSGRTTTVPVVPSEARHPSLNINGISGGQSVDGLQTPCVADRCRAVFDRRFLIEEGFDATRREIVEVLDTVARNTPEFHYTLEDLMTVHPVRTPDESPLVAVLATHIREVIGHEALPVASPGTYDQKHVARIAGVEHCVAYGPGVLDVAHQPDEWCGIEDLMNATKVIALTMMDLVGVA